MAELYGSEQFEVNRASEADYATGCRYFSHWESEDLKSCSPFAVPIGAMKIAGKVVTESNNLCKYMFLREAPQLGRADEDPTPQTRV